MTEVKLCGMTRPEDVECAVTLGVRYVGCVFAGGPRNQTMARAISLFDATGAPPPGRVGVFASIGAPALAAAAEGLRLEAVQMHDDPSREAVSMLRREPGFAAEIWAVLRCRPGEALPSDAADLWLAADALVLDARVAGQLGGTGAALSWSDLADTVTRLRAHSARSRLVLAGGLTPDNVGDAIAALRPDVVNVSSGVESAPGRKDPARMRAFVEAVSAADRLVRSAPPSTLHPHPPASQ